MLNPAAFAFQELSLDPYRWQVESLLAIGRREKVAIAASNESGKTAVVVATSVLWFLETFPKGRVVVTSGSFDQVKEQLWRALESYKHKYPHWTWNECNIKTPEGGFALGFSTNDPGRAEGWHCGKGMGFIPGFDAACDADDWEAAMAAIAASSDESAPLFYIIDEAKTVKDGIFQAVDRCGPQFRLYVSSPGGPYGQFYRCFNRERKFFYTIRVTSEQCPHISVEKREEDIARYGIDHPFIRSMHFAEFAEGGESLVLTAQDLEVALANQPDPDYHGEKVGFCDFAAGGDENAFSFRQGNAVRLIDAWREKDTMDALNRFHAHFRANGLHPGEVWGDAAGLGGPICDASKKLGFSLNRYHGGTPPTDQPKKKKYAKGRKAPPLSNYKDLNSQVWYEAARRIKAGEVCFPDGIDDDTFEQLTTRPGGYTEKGLLAIVPKSRPRAGVVGEKSETGITLKSLGLPSPDRAETIMGSIFCGAKMKGTWTQETVEKARVVQSPFATPTVRW